MDEKVIYSCVDQEHNTWNCRGCGYIETFEADGPVENGWNFCPGCGHEIEVEAVSPCPFDNGNCMCQFCEAQCNNGLNCSDCRCEGKPVHDIHLCTASSETSPSTFGTGCAITAGRLIPERVSGTYLYKLKEDKHMSELTLRFGEARLHVEGDADLVARERAAFLEHLGRLDRQSEKAGELLAVLLRAGRAPEKAEEPVSKKAEPEEPAEEKSATQDDLCRLRSHPRRLRQPVPVEAGEGRGQAGPPARPVRRDRGAAGYRRDRHRGLLLRDAHFGPLRLQRLLGRGRDEPTRRPTRPGISRARAASTFWRTSIRTSRRNGGRSSCPGPSWRPSRASG